MNYDLHEEIREYWSVRAETFDADFGHGIATAPEFAAWADLLRNALGPEPRNVLELACGTGEVTRVLLRLGHRVTALDFAEPMLDRARAKHGTHPNARLRLADATATGEPSGTYDAVVCRHLVWTLIDPLAALQDWHRVLRPGGVLLVIDGDWCRPSPAGRFAQQLMGWLSAWDGPGVFDRTGLAARHEAIMARLPFGSGLTFERLAPLAVAAGFTQSAKLPHTRILRAQRQGATLRNKLRTMVYRRFILRATRTG